MLVDPDKLDGVRQVVDETVSEIHLSTGVPIAEAREIIAGDMGYMLTATVFNNWVAAWALTPKEFKRFGFEPSSKGLDIRSRRQYVLYSHRRVWAANPDLAVTAVICRLLDPSVDIAMSREKQELYYPSNPIGEHWAGEFLGIGWRSNLMYGDLNDRRAFHDWDFWGTAERRRRNIA